MLGTRIVLNNLLFENVFDTKLFGVVPFINSNWPKNFEVGFEEAKKFLYDLDSVSANIGPLSLHFKFCIIANIISTTLILWKGSLRNITFHDVFVLYYLVKKIKIN